jgi:hypothetical protein
VRYNPGEMVRVVSRSGRFRISWVYEPIYHGDCGDRECVEWRVREVDEEGKVVSSIAVPECEMLDVEPGEPC